MMAGEMEAYVDDPSIFFDDASQGVSWPLCAMGTGRTPGCWRCGSDQHLRRECTHPAADTDRKGLPLNQWAKTPKPTQTQSTNGPLSAWPARGQGAATAAPPTVAQVANLTARFDRQESMFEAVLERLSATLPSPSTGAASGLGQDIDVTAEIPVMQLATAVPLPA